MTARLYVLNLSDSKKPLHTVPDLTFGGETKEITDPNQIPDDKEPLILYILAHAVPDALVSPALQQFLTRMRKFTGSSELIPEDVFAAFVKQRRGTNKTVIIWDLCFARSFEEIRAGWVGMPYVHIFSCAAYEQGWHTGAATTPPRQTLFSMALKKAIELGFKTWRDLESQLTEHLADVQQPSIPVHPSPAEFGLAPPPALTTAAFAPTTHTDAAQNRGVTEPSWEASDEARA